MSVLHRTPNKSNAPATSLLSQPPAFRTAPPSPGEGSTERPQLPATAPVQARSELDKHGRVRRTRAGGIWSAVIAAAAILILLLIFVLQNSSTIRIHFVGFSGSLSLAVALLLSVVGGVLLAAIPGTARIIQLRRSVKRSGQGR